MMMVRNKILIRLVLEVLLRCQLQTDALKDGDGTGGSVRTDENL